MKSIYNLKKMKLCFKQGNFIGWQLFCDLLSRRLVTIVVFSIVKAANPNSFLFINVAAEREIFNYFHRKTCPL